jgi:hydroxymethylglutaryl-CoA lyase
MGGRNVHLPESVVVCEVGLRDGLQNEKTQLRTEQKSELLEMFQEAGVRIVEVGSFVNPKAVPQMADTEDVFRRLRPRESAEYRVLVLNAKGLDRAVACGVRKAKFTISASRTHQMKNANRPPEALFEQLGELASSAAARNVVLSGAISTAFGCPFEGEISPEKVAGVAREFEKVGVREISLSDTTGMANPRQVYAMCLEMRERFPGVVWNLHFHNTRGMGLANVLAGMQAGVTRFDASLGGLGGCPFAPGATGNIATEDLLHMCAEMGIETGIDLDRMIAAARLLQEWIGHDLPGAVLKAGKNSDLHRTCEKNEN